MSATKDKYVKRSLLLMELDEARDHLDELIGLLKDRDVELGSSESSVLFAHVYAHLNRCWNARRLESEIGEGEWDRYSAFPTDLAPIG